MINFSKELNCIYQKIAELDYNEKYIRKNFFHSPINRDEAIKYIQELFPIHLAKSREIFKEILTFPTGCGRINILDIGCGPFTFSQAILEELIWRSKRYSNGIYKINIKGVDLSETQLEFGMQMLNDWKKIRKDSGWDISTSPLIDNANFDSSHLEIIDWIKNSELDYLIIGFSASISSGVNRALKIIKKIFPYIKNSNFSIIIVAPKEYENKRDLDKIREFLTKFTSLNLNYKKLKFSLQKPDSMEVYSKKRIIKNVPFKTLFCENYIKIHFSYLKILNLLDSYKKMVIPFNKAKRWLNCRKVTDHIGLKLYQYDFNLSYNLLIKNLLTTGKYDYTQYPIRKGLDFQASREVCFVPVNICVLNIILIEVWGKHLDRRLPSYIYGSRLIQRFSLNRIFKRYGSLYRDFIQTGSTIPHKRNILLYQTDIKNCYGTIKKKSLIKDLKDDFEDLMASDLGEQYSFYSSNPSESIELILKSLNNIFGDSEGIPIGLPISPIIVNNFLTKLDENIRELPCVKDYGRYLDDIRIIVKEDNTEQFGENFNKVIDKKIKDLELNQKENKAGKIKTIEYFGSSIILQKNSELQILEDIFLEIMYPIYLVGKSLREIDAFNTNYNNLSDELRNIIILLSSSLKELGIFIDHEFLERIFITSFFHKKKSKRKEFSPLKIPKEICNISESNILAEKIKKINIAWYKKYIQIQNFMYNELHEELLIWDDIIKDLEDLYNNYDDNEKTEEYQSMKKELLKKLSKNKFILSFRKIRFLAYRLSLIKAIQFKEKDNPILQKLIKFDLIGFPIKLTGLLCYRYGHIDLLKNKLIESCKRGHHPLTSDEEICPRIYGNEIGSLIHLLGLYFEENNDNFDSDEWKGVLQFFLENGRFDEKLSTTEFVLRLNISSLWTYNFWLQLLEREGNVFIIKNLVLCVASHDQLQNNIPMEVKNKLIKIYKKDEVLINLVLHLWSKIQKDGIKILFQKDDVLTLIDFFDKEIDYELELTSDYEWEEGFEINEFYESDDILDDLPDDYGEDEYY